MGILFSAGVIDGNVPGSPLARDPCSFHESIHNVKHEIVITPKMSFGTGHHQPPHFDGNRHARD